VFSKTGVAGFLALVMVVASLDLAFAQTGATPSPPGAAVYFIDLKDGQTLPPKFTVHFGLKGMGVAPAGSDKENSGHHHLLIDTELPPLGKPIPNDFNHLHYGAGQTEAEITLPPGDHTLQLLLGDRAHIPTTPALMSERIHVHVVEGATPPAPSVVQAGRHPSPPGAKVYFVYPTNHATISTTPVIRFGLVGMGVAPAGFEKLNTGHHHLLVDTDLPPFDRPIPNDFNHLHFGAGQTEAKITLTPGRHKLQLLLGDGGHIPHDPPVYSEPIEVTVTASGKVSQAKTSSAASSEASSEPSSERTSSDVSTPAPKPSQAKARGRSAEKARPRIAQKPKRHWHWEYIQVD
jgi:hypothetical protein